MEARLLNPAVKMPRMFVGAEPFVHSMDWEDGTRVEFDTNSLCTVQVDKETTADNLEGLLFSRIAPFFKHFPNSPPRSLVLNLTHGCNLACEYCFAAAYDPSTAMTIETAMQAVKLLNEKLPMHISFFGGEPLLNWSVLVKVAEQARLIAAARKVDCRLHVTTNGTQIDAMKAATLKRLGFSVLVSLDGPQEIHDAARKTKKGEGSFNAVMRGLTCLKQAGCSNRVMARSTFSGSEPRLVERLEFFASLHEAGLINGVSIEPAILTEGCGAAPTEEIDQTSLTQEWHAAAVWYVKRIKEKKPFPFFYFRKLIQRILNYDWHGNECGAGRGYITAAPDGSLHACHRETGTKIGSLEEGFDAKARNPWQQNCLAVHAECQHCWARYLCGGGCAQARVAVGGRIGAPTPHICLAKQTMFREVFWILANLTYEEAHAHAK